MTFSPFEENNIGERDCTDKQVTGDDSTIFSYIQKVDNDDTVKDDIQPPACKKRKHSTAQIDRLQVNTDITGEGLINIDGDVTAGGITLSSRKDFDIPHPTKDGWRLRHVCLEGPEAGVYIRGKLKGTTITVPEYWKGLVDEDSITVHLTPIGSGQNLYVDSIEWGRRIQVRNASGGPIECFYLIQGERKDGEKLIVEYEGKSIEDYPGDNSQYSHNK
jgi:hypothetical protein